MRFPGVASHAGTGFVIKRLGGCRHRALRSGAAEKSEFTAEPRRHGRIGPLSHRVIGRLLAILSLLAASGLGLDREAFTFTNYDLQIRIEPATPLLTATGKLRLRNDSPTPQRVVVLQISSTLEWKSILLNNKPVQYLTQPYTSDVDHTGELSEAVVSLPREVPPKGTVELDIAYAGAVPQDATRLERSGTSRLRSHCVYHWQPARLAPCRFWFPTVPAVLGSLKRAGPPCIQPTAIGSRWGWSRQFWLQPTTLCSSAHPRACTTSAARMLRPRTTPMLLLRRRR